MIRHGEPPYLECSSKGDTRFSAFFARLKKYNGRSIEALYQSNKVFERDRNGVDQNGHMYNWRDAKGHHALNQQENALYYHQLWREYLLENPDLINVLVGASGLSDLFGVRGHVCQATTLWSIREEYIRTGTISPIHK